MEFSGSIKLDNENQQQVPVETKITSSILKWEHNSNDKTPTTVDETVEAVVATLREKQTFKFGEGSSNGSYYFCSHTYCTYNMSQHSMITVINAVKEKLTELKYPSITSRSEQHQGPTESMDYQNLTYHYHFPDSSLNAQFQRIAESALKGLVELETIEFTYDNDYYRFDTPSSYAVHKMTSKNDLLNVIQRVKNLAQAKAIQIVENTTSFDGDHAEYGYKSYILAKSKI